MKLSTMTTMICLSSCLAASAEAAVLVSNLDQPRRDASIIQANPTGLVPLPWGAQSFVTDGNAYHLDTITVMLGDVISDPTPVFELHADSGSSTTPGALIASLTLSGGTIDDGAPKALTLAPVGSPTLAASTTYWLVVGALGVGSFTWEYAEGNGQSGAGGLGNYAYSDDQGASWDNFGADNPFKLAVNVSAVPVPGMAVLFGGAVLGLLRRRR